MSCSVFYHHGKTQESELRVDSSTHSANVTEQGLGRNTDMTAVVILHSIRFEFRRELPFALPLLPSTLSQTCLPSFPQRFHITVRLTPALLPSTALTVPIPWPLCYLCCSHQPLFRHGAGEAAVVVLCGNCKRRCSGCRGLPQRRPGRRWRRNFRVHGCWRCCCCSRRLLSEGEIGR